MYKLSETLLDKAGTGYFPEEQFDQLAMMAYNDWIEKEYDKLEVDQEHTSRLRYLYKTFTKANSNVVMLNLNSGEIPDYRYLIRFNAKFRKECNNKVTYPVVSITKAQNDDIDILQNDPFNKGTNDEPLYIQTEQSGIPILLIFSDTIPLEINATYVRTPNGIFSQISPGNIFEMPDYIAEEIVDLTVKKHLGILENFNRVATETQEINQRK